ncbi:phosphotransferase [Actinokineospora iranica]|uniref:Streptomycin 6-kinase n=1 Tax=Actinokineospora iranica TaxID=1271860 RepID=A0A1G6M023_9PSEU|nr:phosphotransferase [Actinokineospora iranica]SDC48335.1 streptomycin 6-kinase [Actinokineospora iranica]
MTGERPLIEDRLRRRFGDSVLPWVAALPDLLNDLAAAWDLELGEVFPEGASAVTMRVHRAGTPAVLKVSPDPAFAAEQAEVLRAFAPSGRVPEILAADTAVGALLLELIPGAVGWPTPTRFGALLHDLHTAVPAPEHLTHRDLRSATAEFLPRFPPTGPVTAQDMDRATHILADLLDTQGPPVLLHGDLHQENLLDAGDPRGLVVLDPKACLGDPEFDAVDYVLSAPDIPARRDALLATTTLDPDRLDRWCRAMAPLVAVSFFRRGLPLAPVLTYARA